MTLSRACGIAALAVWAACASAQEFAPDPYTLFLAHFNTPARRADYAVGLCEFAGDGARLVSGYYGMALDLRRRGLSPDFMNQCADYTPRYTGWGFHARGNVNPAQGTFECWFRVAAKGRPRMPWGANFLHGSLARSVKDPDKPYYASFSIGLDYYRLTYVLPTLARRVFKGQIVFNQVKGFRRTLQPEEWRHFALCWSQGEMTIWLDGRLLASFDMTGQFGLVLMDNPVRYLNMADVVVDELRISNVPRYERAFEPRWRGGERPAYAFPGVPGLKRYPAKRFDPPVPAASPAPEAGEAVNVRLGAFALRLLRRDGRLVGWSADGLRGPACAEGLRLYRGLEREPLAVASADAFRTAPGRVRFVQRFQGDVAARQEIAAAGDGLVWRIELENRGEREVWLEWLLGLPVPFERVEEIFDGCEPRHAIRLPRHRDEYANALPFAAAAGQGRFLGLGVDPHIGLNDIVSEWIPLARGGVIRQGSKLALSPGESFAYTLRVVQGRGEFGVLDAVAAFHALFPDLYRLRSDIPVYSYMPATQHSGYSKGVDMKRVGYAGGFWGHGPSADKGDEFGTPRFWNNPKYDGDKHYREYARRIQRLWGSIEDLRQYITLWYRQAYENFYPVRRFHTCPDLTAEYLVKALWPGHRPNEDPLCFGQYYYPIWQAWLVNEYDTPLGAHFREHARRYLRQTKGYCPGFINDMSHAGSLYRHNDPIAQRTPGRSFSPDLGTFVRKAVGRQQRYETINRFVDNGHRMSFWSDGGAFSYTLCAYSAAVAIEGAAMYRDLTGPGDYLVPARFMIGEKPFTAMTTLNDDWIGRYLKPEEFTPARLRDYYRFCERQLVLFCLEHGVTLDPTSYMWGRQFSLESAPVMVESAVRGRRLVPAARVARPLWVRRSGRGLDTLLVVGDHSPRPARADVRVLNRYFRSAAPLFAPYYGGRVRHVVDPDHTTIQDVVVRARDFAAFKAVALLRVRSRGAAEVNFAGDGLALRLAIELDAAAPATLRLRSFAPLYEIARVEVNGKPAPDFRPDAPLALPAGRSLVRVEYRNRSLRFTADEWRGVELIKDRKTNFCLVADRGVEWKVRPQSRFTFRLGFERGTANMLNEFIEQYDTENGVVGDLKPAAFVPAKPKGWSGWTVTFRRDFRTRPGVVRVDERTREIRFVGATQGELRRAMVVFLRLLDRRYPHVGRFFPLRFGRPPYKAGQPLPLDKWVLRKDTREFFRKFADPLFLAKPILRREYERLYAGSNMDFAGRYAMRFSPDIFEPTYGDDFVYGYEGPGRAETQEELRRSAGEPERR